MRRLVLAPFLALFGWQLQAQQVVLQSVEGFSVGFVGADPEYTVQLNYTATPTNPAMTLNGQSVLRSGTSGRAAVFTVSPGTSPHNAMQSGFFTLRHFQVFSGTIGPVSVEGSPNFAFSGPAAPVIDDVQVTPATGGNVRYTISGSNLLVPNQNLITFTSRTAPCIDPENRTLEPGSTSTRITIVLPQCTGTHQIAVYRYIRGTPSSPNSQSASALLLLASRRFTVSPVPLTLTELRPDRGIVGTAVSLTAIGTGFVPPTPGYAGSTLIWRRNGVETRLSTTFQSATSLTTTIPASLMVNAPATVDILVENVTPSCFDYVGVTVSALGCDRSNTRPFNILPFVLSLDQLVPDRAGTRAANGPPQDFTLIGQGFASNAQVFWHPFNGAPFVELEVRGRTGTTQIQARIPADLLTEPRVPNVFVRNPATANSPQQESNTKPFTVFASLRIDRLDPPALPAGSPATKVTAFGSGFSPNTRIGFRDTSGTRQPSPQVVNLQQGTIELTMDQTLLAVQKTWQVVAIDGSTISDSIPFEVTSGVVISTLDPPSRAADSGTFTLTINGSGFGEGSAVLFGDQTLSPTTRAVNRITVTVTAPAVAGKLPVRVRVGSGVSAITSNSVDIEFTQPVPRIISLNPPSRAANSGDFDLTIDGRNFLPSPSVTFGGQAVTIQGTPTATTIVVRVPNARIQQAGNQPVVVRVNNLASDPFNLQVTQGGPTISTLNPPNRAAGTGAFVLTVSGQNLTGVSVQFDGQSVGTTGTPTATSLQVQIPGTLLQTARTVKVVVTGSGNQSASSDFIVLPPQIPNLNLSSASANVNPGGNTTASLGLTANAPLEVTGTLELTFTPAVTGLPTNYVDPAMVFVSGGQRRLDFRIPAGQANAEIPGGGAINVGTVAGTVNVSVIALRSGGADISNRPPVRQITVPRAAPTITPNSAQLVSAAGGVAVRLQGFSPNRDISQAAINFTIASGVTANGSTSFTVPLQQAFTAWFNSDAGRNNGSRFFLEIPFTVTEGDPNRITGFTISLTGSDNAASATVTGSR